MNSKQTLYFSQLLGRKVFGPGNAALGRVGDIVVDIGQPRPKIIAVIAVSGSKSRNVDFSACRLEGKDRGLRVWAQEEKEADLGRDNLLYLRKHLLDKQIVDVDGRKLVRVNDLVVEVIPAGAFLVAVDVGIEGLMRRLDLEKPLNALLGPFKRALPSKLILWKEVEAVDFPRMEIKLSTAYSKLATFHPSDLADILEDLDRNSQMALFQSLDEERAADVLEEMEPGAQVSLLEAMPLERAADVLEKMPADEVADIMDGLGKEKAESLLSEMEVGASREVRTLMEYPENTVGSLMSTDFLCFPAAETVDGVLRELRARKPEAETIYYLYVADQKGKYVAMVPLSDLVVSEPELPLSAIMNTDVDALSDGADIYSIAELLLKYKLHAVPVVNSDRAMVGTIVIEDVLEHVMSLRRRK